MTEKIDVKDEICKLLSERGDMGWYEMEIRLNVPRNMFQPGYTLMTYLNEMIGEQKIKLTADNKYALVL